ncbi:hypothetical protein BOTBODRAFT_39619 [Botryobasidium botryosum FD-172 SS1]|uniref:Geranylgeranyl pyrophosphate synthetase n=1 Tax=Botryobasidium botryosum (strain FD-172 SS1) TaxID=930990 RepID=A0A067LVX4_BOTB1|nr:hypothetical protein BOTBODRAFT_39619 [Botryobasidium botryosum FD-172 SS1]
MMSSSRTRPRRLRGAIRSGVGELIRTLEVPEAKSSVDFNEVAISDLQPVASYNWTSARSPTIIIPGCPMVWTKKEPPFTIPRDSGVSYIDQNAARCLPLMNPLNPLFLALNVMAPEFDMASVDLVTDRNNLRKLHRWVTNSADKDFRIDVQLIGRETVVLRRWEMHNTEGGNKSRGYGHSFERETTSVPPGFEGSTSHHRIVRYSFGSLRILCRFEADACDLGSPSDGLEELVGGFSQIKVSAPPKLPSTGGPTKASKIRVVRAGQLVPQSSLMELKTRSAKGNVRWKDIWPQAFFSGTPTVVVGRHEEGNFVSIERKSFEGMYSEQAGVGLEQLIQVLKDIRDIVVSRGKGRGVTLICERSQRGRIEVREGAVGGPAISSELLAKYQS